MAIDVLQSNVDELSKFIDKLVSKITKTKYITTQTILLKSI